jgi:hypothetical protein
MVYFGDHVFHQSNFLRMDGWATYVWHIHSEKYIESNYFRNIHISACEILKEEISKASVLAYLTLIRTTEM